MSSPARIMVHVQYNSMTRGYKLNHMLTQYVNTMC